jgi:hypothetical protein
MMKMLAFSVLALGLGGCTATTDDTAAQTRAARADTQLAEATRGRVAGPPVSCVSQRLLRGNKSAGEGAIIFEGTNGLVYVNRPPAGCPELNTFRALQTRTIGTQLCRGDIATVFDPTSGMFYGSCGLGDFVPYRRVASR